MTTSSTAWLSLNALFSQVNAHHEDWLDNPHTFEQRLPRFRAIWSQIAARFADHPQELFFEVFNEPWAMTVAQLNEMNSAMLSTVRRTNPHRIVVIGGLQWMNPDWLVENPDAMHLPSIQEDPQIMLGIHYYDPVEYALNDPPSVTQWGNAEDIAVMHDWMEAIHNYAANRSRSVFYDEFACSHAQNATTGRVVWYEEHRKGIEAHGFAAAVWDDDASNMVYDRIANTWDEPVLVALGL